MRPTARFRWHSIRGRRGPPCPVGMEGAARHEGLCWVLPQDPHPPLPGLTKHTELVSVDGGRFDATTHQFDGPGGRVIRTHVARSTVDRPRVGLSRSLAAVNAVDRGGRSQDGNMSGIALEDIGYS